LLDFLSNMFSIFSCSGFWGDNDLGREIPLRKSLHQPILPSTRHTGCQHGASASAGGAYNTSLVVAIVNPGVLQVKTRTKRITELFHSYQPYGHQVILILGWFHLVIDHFDCRLERLRRFLWLKYLTTEIITLLTTNIMIRSGIIFSLWP
jgi:hypothetical protein